MLWVKYCRGMFWKPSNVYDRTILKSRYERNGISLGLMELQKRISARHFVRTLLKITVAKSGNYKHLNEY